MGPVSNQITAAALRDRRDCKHQQGGQTLKPEGLMRIWYYKLGKWWHNIYGDKKVAQCLSTRRVRDVPTRNGYGTAAGSLRPPRAVAKGG